MKRLLILGGTGDAVKLASLAVNLPGLEVITSLAGRTSAPQHLVGDVRIGGFGGEAGLVKYLQVERIDLVIDATHPFAAQISGHIAGAATKLGIPRLMLVRPAWLRSPEDNWIEVESITAAVESIPAATTRIFVTIGRQQLSPFASRGKDFCHPPCFLACLWHHWLMRLARTGKRSTGGCLCNNNRSRNIFNL